MIDELVRRIAALESLLKKVELQARSEYTGGIVSRDVADLPVTGQTGWLFFASNGRKSGEGAGNGTGVIVYWNPATSQWLRVEDNAVVSA